MIIRTAANEAEIEQSIELFWADEPGHTPEYKASALDHWLFMYTDFPAGFWLAEDNDTQQIVGVATMVRRPPQAIVANFFVLAAYQGRGLGRRLLTQAIATCTDCDRLAVHASGNPSAQSLYMKFGMFPQPYSVALTGHPQDHPAPSELMAENRPIDEIVSFVDSLDLANLGFTRRVNHRRWARDGSYFIVPARDRAGDQPVGYFRVTAERRIGPLVVSDERWMVAALDLAIQKQRELSPGEQNILVPGANTNALACLMARNFRIAYLELLLSSHPMPELSKVVFNDTDFF